MSSVNAGEKVRFVERVNAVLNYDLKPGQKKRGRGVRKEISQPQRETVYVEKVIVTEDGKGNVISRQVIRADASERALKEVERIEAPKKKKSKTNRKARSSQKRIKRK
jgi:hypothetical protein